MKSKIVPILLVSILVLGSGIAAIAKMDVKDGIGSREIEMDFSEPKITDYGKYIGVSVEETNSFIHQTGKPILPIYSSVMKFPIGTKIVDVKIEHSPIKLMKINKEITLFPGPVSSNDHPNRTNQLYDSINPFPNDWYDYRMGCGIDGNERVIFLTVRFYPVRYLSAMGILEFVDHAAIKVAYEKPPCPMPKSAESYDMVIISPSEFSNELKPLVDHKNNSDVSTKLVTLKEIYENYDGRDKQEQIKYFIKYAYDNWEVKYVMLVGGVDKLPVRYAHLETNHGYPEPCFISDLYYADIYDANGSFCSWDSNNNSIFGEWTMSGKRDEVDLYPDVYLGRLACRNRIEVRIMVNKIIDYEENTHGKWFKNMVVVGGDTFDDRPYGTDVNEGEVANDKALEYMKNFDPTRLWASKGNLNIFTIWLAISKGAGFTYFCGHGSPRLWATHPPHNYEKWIGNWGIWNTPFLLNGRRLPILMVGGCHNSQFNMSYECWSWLFARKMGGGAIASIGCTGYGGVAIGDFNHDDIPDCVQYFDGWFETHFFKLYA